MSDGPVMKHTWFSFFLESRRRLQEATNEAVRRLNEGDPMPEMTIDEAIADCVRQVPECAPGLPHVYHQGFGWCHQAGPTGGHGGGMPVFLEPETARALWFDAAWEWLVKEWGEAKLEQAGKGYQMTIPARDSNSGQWFKKQTDGCPTKYHALAAAVLLAKGLKP